MWNETPEGTKGKGPSNNFDPMATWEFRTLATETLDRLSRTGIRSISAAADALKDMILNAQPLTPTQTGTTTPQPLWPNHEGLFGASDASRTTPSPTALATDNESMAFAQTMQTKTNTTTPPPHLSLASYFKNNTEYSAQALRNTETDGKDKPALFWIFYHNGIDRPTGRRKRTTPPGWFLCQAYQTAAGNKKAATVHYNLLHHPFDEDTKHAINANSLTGNGNIAKSKTPPLIKELTAKQELEQETTIPNFLKCMATAAAGPVPSDDNATIQHLKQPPKIIPSTTLDKLREEARNSNTTKTILSMPHLKYDPHHLCLYEYLHYSHLPSRRHARHVREHRERLREPL
jgi:hypothetical protein